MSDTDSMDFSSGWGTSNSGSSSDSEGSGNSSWPGSSTDSDSPDSEGNDRAEELPPGSRGATAFMNELRERLPDFKYRAFLYAMVLVTAALSKYYYRYL